MQFKKTWFGYLNFILSVIITGAIIIALVFVMLKELPGFLTNGTDSNPADIAAIILSVVIFSAICLFFCIFRKIRFLMSKKINIFRNNTLSEVVGGAVSLGLFISGLFLRVNMTWVNDKVIGFDDKRVYELFNKSSVFHFNSLDDLYDYSLAFIYRFIGYKPEYYVWYNLILLSLAILCIYAIVRNLFGGSVTIVPMAFLCLSPKVSSLIVLDSYLIFSVFIFALLLLIFTGIIGALKNLNHFDIWGNILVQICVFLIVAVVPIFLTNGLKNAPVFDFNASFKILRLFLPFSNELLNIVFISLILFGALSFLFSKIDRLSVISLIWMCSAFVYLFSENVWPPECLMIILFAVFAGLGFDELLLSKVLSEEDLIDKVKKEVIVEIKEAPKQDDSYIIFDNSNLTAEKTRVKEENNQETVQTKETSDISTVPDEKSSENTVKLIENPLPVPKKPEIKQIEFNDSYDDISEFDIDIKDNDDFDV